ncbi:hypothetical protein H4W34_005836 [Actinomadura algeriensis]|uniref:Uncharacterized protein n=1 Tax=Actinomadura algeriensis TaxID=1679523 RepID=A0ABR9JZK6_9ACTN|nr:hypothetical protein [Actinomadura algeriensis]
MDELVPSAADAVAGIDVRAATRPRLLEPAAAEGTPA